MDDVPDGDHCLADLVRDQHTDRGSAKAAHKRALCDQGSKQGAAKQAQQVRGSQERRGLVLNDSRLRLLPHLLHCYSGLLFLDVPRMLQRLALSLPCLHWSLTTSSSVVANFELFFLTWWCCGPALSLPCPSFIEHRLVAFIEHRLTPSQP